MRGVMTVRNCKECGAKGDIWLSDIGECSICNYHRHRWEEDNLHRYAMCMICYNDVIAPSLDDVHCLWDDNGWAGRPVCSECFELLRWLVPEKLDVPIKRKKPKKQGLEVWL